MMTANEHIIFLDLQEFFADDRRRSKILINQNCRKIIDLEEKITQIFGITSFHLLSDGHFLPSCEDIALLKNGEVVCVRPSICPSKSNLLDESFYKSSYIEKNLKLKDEASAEVVLKDIRKDESNKELHIEEADSIPKRRKKKHRIEENNDTLEENQYTLYASTPNNTNASLRLADPQENEEMVERPLCLSDRKKKKKIKLEKNSYDSGLKLKKTKKRKHQVLDDGTTGDDSILKRNCAENVENEEVCQVKKRKKKCSREKTESIGNPTTDNTNNQEISNSNQKNNVNIIKIDIIRERTNSEKVKKSSDVCCEDLENSNSKMPFQDQNLDKESRSKNDTEADKFHPRPLPHIKARDKESWSTLPLSKTTNIVKIIKLPIDKIEIDLSRFVFVPNVCIPHETPQEINTSNTVDGISQTHTMKETEQKNASDPSPCDEQPAHKDKSSEPNSLSTSPNQTKFTNSLESSQNKPIPISENEKQNCDGDEMAKNQNSSSVSFACQNSNNLEMDENSQDSTRSRNEALEVWRKKICEKTQGFKMATLSNLNELCEEPALKRCSSENKNENGESGVLLDINESQFNPILNEAIGNSSTLMDTQNERPVKTQDTTKEYSSGANTDVGLGTQDISELVEITSSNGISSPTIEEDSSLSVSIVSDIGQSFEMKRKRRRRHKKKKKNDTFFNEEFKDVSWVKNTPFVPAKPKIHVRFDDSDNDLPVLQNKTQSEIQDLGENTEMTENVILDASSQREPEISSKAPKTESIAEVPNEIEKIHHAENEETPDCSRSQEFPNSSKEKILERYKSELLRIVDAMNTVKNQDFSCQNNSSP
ncbi:general transcriptional corepressor trfA-like [Coccinella septempunctata]|uniref:general transcriptional corepressor trfA-like n=1 Tax=Coccinella septempunctata TaxID=41139 RepID=UPI001D088FA8|nr:general transcriptional corepressor trfA-like [Coccinella septempunctata]